MRRFSEESPAALDATPRYRGYSISVRCVDHGIAGLLFAATRVERRRRAPPSTHLDQQLAGQAAEESSAGRCAALANRLHIPGGQPPHRRKPNLGERRALTGEPLPAQLTATAAAQREARSARTHIKGVRPSSRLSAAVDLGIGEGPPRQLAETAAVGVDHLAWPRG